MSHRSSIGIAIAATALVAGGIGFIAGKSQAPSGGSDTANAGSGILKSASSRPWDDGEGAKSFEGAKLPDEAAATRRPGLGTRPPASIEAEPARREGRESIHRMLDQPGPISRWRDVMTFAENSGPDQISGALDELIDMPKGIDTIVARFFLYSRFGENDPEAALAAIEGLPPGEIDLARQSVLGGWAGKHPEAAAAFLLEQAESDGNLRPDHAGLVRNVVDEWARTDPAAAFQWSLVLEGDGRKIGVGTVLRQWAAQAPRDAAAAAEQMADDTDRGMALRTVAEHWARTDPQAALSWASELTDEVKNSVTSRALAGWAEKEPRLAAQALSDLAPGDDRDRAMRVTAAQWSEREPRETAEWVLSQPDNDARKAAIRDVVRRWARKDEVGASEWLVGQSPGPAKDSAIVALSNTVSGNDPEAAAIWADTIIDPALRDIQTRSVVRNWVKKDRNAALNWLRSADVSDAVKTEFFQE